MSNLDKNKNLVKKCTVIFGCVALFIFFMAAVNDEKDMERELGFVESVDIEEASVEYEYPVDRQEEEYAEPENVVPDDVANLVEEDELVNADEELYSSLSHLDSDSEAEVEVNLEEDRGEDADVYLNEDLYQRIHQFNREELEEIVARVCQFPQLGVRFVCDPDWPVVPSEEGAERVLISTDPYITMGIERVNKKFRFLVQINKIYLEKTGLYKEGFQIENVEFAGHDAIMVKAVSAFKDSTQRRDYFYMHDGAMIHISFMLPNTEWTVEDQQNLKQITKSFQPYIEY